MDKIISEMTLAQSAYNLAKETGIGIARAKEQMKNIAFNYFDELLEAARNVQTLQDEVNMLNIALEDSDKELAELKKKSASAKKPAKPAEDLQE